MEKLDKGEQIRLLSRTTILIGVHGNGLSGQLWLKPSPRTTVIEIFFAGGFLYDYEYTARVLGHKHYGIWFDK
jgi:capsular polysaccharide biosynthesis protein